MTNKEKSDLKRFIFFVPLIIALIFVMGFVIQYLWNALLPEIIGVGTVTYWQAMGILLLSKILFGGFSGGKDKKSKKRNCKKSKISDLKEKWNQLDDEQKEKIKREWLELDKNKEEPTQ